MESGGLGCSDALNLDGGPSTQLVAKLPSLTVSVPGGWCVPNALIALPGT
jgi:Phosphodiester glycosidase